MPEMHALKAFGAVYLVEEVELDQQRFKFGAGKPPANTANEAGKMKPARMAGRGLQETREAGLQIGGATDVGLSAGIWALQ